MPAHAPAPAGATGSPFPLNWSAQDLADAVPLRLHQIVRFDPDALTPADGVAPRARNHRGYAPRATAAPLFRILG